jgi:hypothetical protein
MAAVKDKKKNSMLTKNGKQRLGPLNIEQLSKMLDGARKKHIAKIKRAIAKRLQTQQFGKDAEPIVTE